MQTISLGFNDIPQFNQKDKDYTLDSERFKEFINQTFEIDNFKNIIKQRESFKTNRTLLSKVLNKQYTGLSNSDKTNRYLELIDSENSFTVTTAHQPSLLTGPLYYCYKILSTIHLAERLQKIYKDKNIIPVFVLGAEDHDFEEINHLQLFGKQISWNSNNQGSVGRFSLDGILEVLDQTKDILGENSKAQELISSFYTAYEKANDYAEFSFLITHQLFDRFGLLILRMDEREFKDAFKHVIKSEVFLTPSQQLIEQEQDNLELLGYGKQAHAREINLFYQCDQGRKRIVSEKGLYKILDSKLSFTEDQLREEIDNNPQNFSPNVITRPLFQEFILPNLAYIGGGGEIAYWLERKSQFEHFDISFPMLIRRNSALLMNKNVENQIADLNLKVTDFFQEEIDIINKYIHISDHPDFSLSPYEKELDAVFGNISEVIKTIDSTLIKTVESELVKAKKSVQYLESKLVKSLKHKESVQINRIKKIKEKLFPGGLQERSLNILEFLGNYEGDLLADLLPFMDVFDKDFKIFTLQ